MPLSAERTGARHLALATTALSCGGFAIGTTEFVTMGLLPGIAHGVHVSTPVAGHLISAHAQQPVAGLLTVLLVAALGSVMVVNLQPRRMHVAGQAQTLGAAMNHSALNAPNALGAWLGGRVIAAGLGYSAQSWVGVALSLGGLGVLGCSIALQRRTLADPA